MAKYAPMLFLIFAMVVCSCNGGGKRSNDSDNDSTPSWMNDSAAAEAEQVEPDTVKPRFDTTESMRRYMAASDSAPAYRQGILPQMLEDAPEYVGKILESDTDGFLIVDKYTMKLYRYDRFGRLKENVGIACSRHYGAKHKWKDNRTPEGYFTIEGIYDSTDWLYTDDDGNTSQVKGQFGPRFMRLKGPQASQIGIHGTCSPWSIGGRRSHGCIRLTNENILHMVEICKAGWPVIISPGRRDMAVNKSEGYNIPAVRPMIGSEKATPSKYVPAEPAPKAAAQPSDTLSASKAEVQTVTSKATEKQTVATDTLKY